MIAQTEIIGYALQEWHPRCPTCYNRIKDVSSYPHVPYLLLKAEVKEKIWPETMYRCSDCGKEMLK